MSRKKKAPGVLLYDSWFLAYEFLSDEDAGKILKAIGDHIAGREVNLPPHLMKSTAKMFQEIDENRQAYDARCEQNRANVNKRYTNVIQNGTNVVQSNTNTNTNSNPNPKSNSNPKVTNVTSKESVSKDTPKKATLSLKDVEALLDSYEEIRTNPELRKAFIEFWNMRKASKRGALTKYAFELQIKEAYKIGEGNPEEMTKLVNYAIKKAWIGIYPIKEEKKEKSVFDIINSFEMEEEASGK